MVFWGVLAATLLWSGFNSSASYKENQVLLIKQQLHIDYLEAYIEDNDLPTPAWRKE
jgi:hypothetical protein